MPPYAGPETLWKGVTLVPQSADIVVVIDGRLSLVAYWRSISR